MSKIYSGIIALVAVASLVAGSAYALLSSQATVSGVSFNSETASLKIGAGGGGLTVSNLDLSSFPSIDIYPGFNGWISPVNNPLNLYNESTGNFNLSVKGKITSWASTQGDWNALVDNTYVRVHQVIVNTPGNPSANTLGDASAWVTLRQAYDNEWALPGASIPFGTYPNNKQGYAIEISVDSNAGNEIAGANLNNIVITFTGTQVTP